MKANLFIPRSPQRWKESQCHSRHSENKCTTNVSAVKSASWHVCTRDDECRAVVRRFSFEILVSSAPIVCFASDTHSKVKNDPPKHVACDYLWSRALLWNCINRLRWNTTRSHFINSCLRVNIKFRRLFFSLFDRFPLLPQHFSCRFFIIAERTCRKCLVTAACLGLFLRRRIPLSMCSLRSVHFWFSLTLTVNPKIKIHEFFVFLDKPMLGRQ